MTFHHNTTAHKYDTHSYSCRTRASMVPKRHRTIYNTLGLHPISHIYPNSASEPHLPLHSLFSMLRPSSSSAVGRRLSRRFSLALSSLLQSARSCSGCAWMMFLSISSCRSGLSASLIARLSERCTREPSRVRTPLSPSPGSSRYRIGPSLSSLSSPALAVPPTGCRGSPPPPPPESRALTRGQHSSHLETDRPTDRQTRPRHAAAVDGGGAVGAWAGGRCKESFHAHQLFSRGQPYGQCGYDASLAGRWRAQ